MRRIAMLITTTLLFSACTLLPQASAPAATPASTPSAWQTPQSKQLSALTNVIEVGGSNFAFSKKEIRVKKGADVAIKFMNNEGFHDFVVEGLNVRTKTLQEGQSETITIPTDKTGTYAYYCSVGNHRQQGMEGKLIIE